MIETKLFAFHPKGPGPNSLFVAAKSVDEAVDAVQAYIAEQLKAGKSPYFCNGWPDDFEIEMASRGIVLLGDNN